MTAPPEDTSSYRFLSDVIIARGLVDASAMKAALQASLAGRSLTEILVDHGHLGEDDLARTLAEHHGLDHVDLDVFEVDPDAASLIEPDVARRFGAVPIAVSATGALVVALHDPNGSTAALEFARLTGRVIQIAVASRSQVEELINSLRTRHPVDEMLRAASETRASVIAPQAAAVAPSAAPAAPPPAAPPAPAAVAPAAAAQAAPASAGANLQLDAVRQRAEAAERRCHEAEERARGAEELARLAEARARASEERAQAARELADAAARDGATSVAGAADSDLVMRLLHACDLLEREALTRGPEAEVLRAVVEAERAQRMQLEAQLRYPPEAVLALQARVEDLEHHLVERPAADVAPPPTDPPAPELEASSPPEAEQSCFAPAPEVEPAAPEAEAIAPEAEAMAPEAEAMVPEELVAEPETAPAMVRMRRRRGLFGPRMRGT